MSKTITPLIGKFVELIVLFLMGSLLAQDFVAGKQIKQGIWDNRQIEYIEGEIALILKPSVSKDDILPRSNCDHHSRKNNKQR